ncbi:MAG: bifunctional folylpolyglutamate synthase/dihydrofolate synthase [Eubacterium sp.]|nr:bifunctional folylpolyglutamate synthase/dihydrofolate synthase [Eubacterium sp.]
MTEQIDTYERAEEYINSIPKFSDKNSMENTRRFLEHLGNPARSCKVIHIAGTNGKGSVCAYLCSVFKEAGILAGMFTSPHLVTMRERISADGKMATEQEFLQAFESVTDKLSDLPEELANLGYHPSFFEFLFFMAMVFFERKGVEYAVLETGLGGRLDATNSVDDKKLCIITSIGYDHMEYLGDTIAQIATEKAGILRTDVPVVYMDRHDAAAMKIGECASRIGAKRIAVPEKAIKEIKIQHKTIDFSLHLNYYDYIGFTVSTTAVYQVENAALAIKALEQLNDGRITVSVMQEGIRRMVWEGRMEEILPSVYLDGAHNIDGIRAFMETVRTQPCHGRRKLLFSMVKEKQYQSVIEAVALSGLFDEIGVVALTSGRALPVDVMEDLYRQYTGLECKAYDSLSAAFEEFVFDRDNEDRVYIVGSLYLVGEVKALLRSLKHD